MTNKILVTGATGFIGKNLIKHLAKQDNNIAILCRQQQPATQISSPKIEMRYGDLLNPESLIKACQNIDVIYHLAGYAHAENQANSDFANKHHEINFLGTKHLLLAAEMAGVKKFIFLSSSKAVADQPKKITEKWNEWPATPYGIAKRKAEEFINEFCVKHNIFSCILRPTLVYGPGCKGNLLQMINAINKGRFPPIPPINNRRSMVSNDDICEATILAANHPNARHKTYFVTDGNNYSTYDLYAAILQHLGKKIPRAHIPLFIFKALGYLGTCGEKILRKNLPINVDKINKLFGTAEYDGSLIHQDLGFKPKQNFFSVLPSIINAYNQAQHKVYN